MAIVLASIALIPAGEVRAAATGYTRIAGQNRIETAIAVSDKGWSSEKSDYVILANGFMYPDALAAVPLSKQLDAPLLLTKGDRLEDAVLKEIKSLGAAKIYILGGKNAVSQQIENDLKTQGFGTIRLAGEDRFGTSVAIAKELERLRGKKPSAVFGVCAANYPDAISAGSAAALSDGVVLYLPVHGQPDKLTEGYIKSSGCKNVYIIGGPYAIGEDVEQYIAGLCGKKPDRVFGQDRYGTSLAVCKKFASLYTGNKMIFATGADFADALVGGTISSKLKSPMLFISGDKLADGAYDYITKRAPQAIYVLGGPYALSDYVLKCYLTNTPITTTTTTTTTTKKQTTTTAKPAKTAYLTFDDGPSANTAKILNILDKYNVKATFFVIYRPGYESTYKRIVSSGHTLALHSYSHSYGTIYKSETAFYSDLGKLESYLKSVTGTTPKKILRFPGGSNNTVSRKHCRGIMTTLTKSVANRGYRYYDWNVDSCDASENRASKSKIISSVRNGIGSKKQIVILMHDAPAKTTTVDALPEIISIIKQKGYTILPITESTPEVHFKVAN